MTQAHINPAIFSFFFAILLLSSTCCLAQGNKEKANMEIEVLTDSISSPYMYFSEINVIPANTVLLRNIQDLSNNKNLNTEKPVERLSKKKELYKLCSEGSIPMEQFTPESYKILSYKNNLLNIEYGYNGFSSSDEYYKYAVFNVNNGERIGYEAMFNNPQKILKLYNKIYASEIKRYLKSLDKNDEDEQETYMLYKEHLESKAAFTLEDLNNLEIIYDASNEKATQLKFHYNGIGGVYRQYFPADFVDFSIEKVKPKLTEAFKKHLGV